MVTVLQDISDPNKQVSTVLKIPVKKDGSIFRGFSAYEKPLEELLPEIRTALDKGTPTYIPGSDNMGPLLIEPYFPQSGLFVFGGGHIAVSLVDMASKLSFVVTLVDDRPSFADKTQFPTAHRVLCRDFQNCFEPLGLNSYSYIVIITRGHRHDAVCLRQALKYDLAYVGMIGSSTRVKRMKHMLMTEGFSKASLENIYSPIGLDIGAITPEEIAVSILAQLIKVKRLKNIEVCPFSADHSPPLAENIRNSRIADDFAAVPRKNTLLCQSESDPEVLRFLSTQKSIAEDAFTQDASFPSAYTPNISASSLPVAIATVIQTSGSTPRGPGAKMVVQFKGTSVGSIGGGSVEAQVLYIAQKMILRAQSCALPKPFTIVKADLNADMAESEGMVCGGTMEILIEILYPEKLPGIAAPGSPTTSASI